MSAIDQPVIWITGAGSGIGRATAGAVAAGSRVAVSGRRPEPLVQTARLVAAAGGEALAIPLDVADAGAVTAAHERITRWGPVTRLVLASGLNTPRRAWADQDLAEFDAVVSTNLLGVVRVIDAVLPGMRRAGDGTIVIVSSYAGWRPSSPPGVAYTASKLALSSVASSLNAQEARHGVRTTLICPGDVDTDFLLLRPDVPPAGARGAMLAPEDVARAIRFVLDSPAHVVVDELVLSPASQAR